MTGSDSMSDSTITSVTRYMLGGIAVVLFLVFGVGGWAATTEIAGAVLAPGTVVYVSPSNMRVFVADYSI